MRHILIIILALAAFTAANAQTPFTHGPGNGIEQQYFDPALAPFYHGVASGDPLDDRVIIWTRVTPNIDTVIDVWWYMATDTGFANIVAKGKLTTDYTKDYTVKVDVTGLQPGTVYYYYFSALNKNSLRGRTHTLPASQIQHLRFAVVSCANYQMGYFNAYKRIAERSDLDAVIHLGDYIYEYATHEYGWTAAINRVHQPDNELRTLDDYRIRHSFYKLDANLRAAHQQHPFITVWDDHETVNNSYKDGAAPGNHDDIEDGDYATRKRNGVRAYLEWMPIRPQQTNSDSRIYRKFSYGNLAELYMVDTRLEERTEQVNNINSPVFNDSTRKILGAEQRQWLIDNMNQSSAKWKIIGNQVMFSEQQAAFKLDAWVGYPYERNLVLNEFKQMNDKNIIILTGDTHRSWAFDLTEHPFDTAHYQPATSKGTFGVEYCTPSVASPNRNESQPGTSPVPAELSELNANPHLRYIDLDNHGYFVLDITNFRAQADYYHVDTDMPSTKDSFDAGWYTWDGQGYLQHATSPSAAKSGIYIPAPYGPAPFAIASPTNIKYDNGDVFLSGIYPNPASGKVYAGLAVNSDKALRINISDMKGSVILSQEYSLQKGNHTIEMNIDTLAQGIYLIQIITDQGTQQKKLIVR